MSASSLPSWSYFHQSSGRDPAGEDVSRGYLIYLLIFATAGWAMAAYDFNLQVMAPSDIAKGLGLSSTQVGLFGFFVDFAELGSVRNSGLGESAAVLAVCGFRRE